jgi:hypothetical protein
MTKVARSKMNQASNVRQRALTDGWDRRLPSRRNDTTFETEHRERGDN